MESERARPLAALVLVAMLGALIVTLGMQRHGPVGPLASASPASTSQVAETRFVLGSTLTPKPHKPAEPKRPSPLTAVAPVASSSSSGSTSSGSSVTDHGRARGHRPAHTHPVGNSHPDGQGQGTRPSDAPTTSTGIAARLVPQDDPASEVPSSLAGGVSAFAFADAAQAWQDAIGAMIQDYGEDAEHQWYVPGQLDAAGGEGP